MDPKSAGLSLIEYIITLAVCSIVVVVLFAVINPHEEYNKWQDRQRQKTSIQVVSASKIFRRTLGSMPWRGEFLCNAGHIPHSTPLSASDFNPSCIYLLESPIEQTSDISGQDFFSELLITANSQDKVSVCFLPKSRVLQTNFSETHYQSDGNSVSSLSQCPAVGCYWCTQ